MGCKLTEQTAEAIGPLEREVFKAELARRPIRFSGLWPRSDTREGIKARTDIAIALVKRGYLHYNDPSAGVQFTCADHPIQLGNLYKPGDSVKLTWLDNDRLDRELA